MKKYILLILVIVIYTNSFASNPIKICSWNLEKFGKSKDDQAIEFIANTLKEFDVIAIVEVVAGYGGAQAVSRLNDELNRKGAKWDYIISEPTTSSPNKKERYAFIWKTSRVKLIGKAWLENKYQVEIEREPFFATFRSEGKEFTLITFHAITKSQQPEKEIKYFKYFPIEYPKNNLLICGDFNCPESNSVFNPLKSIGYKPILSGQKTTLRQTCKNNDCLASEFDNLFYDYKKNSFIKSGVVSFYKSFSSMKEAKKISDHLPIYFQFSIN